MFKNVPTSSKTPIRENIIPDIWEKKKNVPNDQPEAKELNSSRNFRQGCQDVLSGDSSVSLEKKLWGTAIVGPPNVISWFETPSNYGYRLLQP